MLADPMIEVAAHFRSLFELCFDRTLLSLYEIGRPQLRTTIIRDTIFKLNKQQASDFVKIWTDEDYCRFITKVCKEELLELAVQTSTEQVLDMLTDLASRHGQDIANDAGPCACCFTNCLCCLQSLIESIGSHKVKQSMPLAERGLKEFIISEAKSFDAMHDEMMEVYASFTATLTKVMANIDLLKQREIIDVKKKLTDVNPLDLYYEALTREFCGDGDDPQDDDSIDGPEGSDSEPAQAKSATSGSLVKTFLRSIGHTTRLRPCLREGQVIICQQYRAAKESLKREHSQWRIDKDQSLTTPVDDRKVKALIEHDHPGTLFRRAAARALYNRAFFHRQQARTRVAADLLQRARSLDPIQIDYVANLAALFILLRMFPEALKECENGLRLAPKHSRLHFHQGVCHLAAGDSALAHEDFKNSINLAMSDETFRRTLPALSEDGAEVTPAVVTDKLCQWAGQLTAPDLSAPLTNAESILCYTSIPSGQFPRSKSEPINLDGREAKKCMSSLPVCEQGLSSAYKEALVKAVEKAYLEAQKDPFSTDEYDIDCILFLDCFILAHFFWLHALGEDDADVPPSSERGASLRAIVHRAYTCKTERLNGAAVCDAKIGSRPGAHQGVDADKAAAASQDSQRDISKEVNEASAWSASDSDDIGGTVKPLSSQGKRQGTKRSVIASDDNRDGEMSPSSSSSSELNLDESASLVSGQGAPLSEMQTGVKPSTGKKGKKMSSKAQGKQRRIDTPPKLPTPTDSPKAGAQSSATRAPSTPNTPPKMTAGGSQTNQSGRSPCKTLGSSSVKAAGQSPSKSKSVAAPPPGIPTHSPRAEEIALPSSSSSSSQAECRDTGSPRETKPRTRSSSGDVSDIVQEEGHRASDASSGGAISPGEEAGRGERAPHLSKPVGGNTKM